MRDMMSVVASSLLACAAAIAAAGDADVQYDLTATFAGGKVTLEQRVVNGSRSSICLFPDQVDVANAHFLDASGHPLDNIANSGVITVRNTIYVSYPDRLPRTFVSSDDQDSIFRTPGDAAKVTQVEFELFAYDCRQLVSKDYVRAPSAFRKTVKVGVTRGQ